jgi:hypothetical protein
MRYRHKKLSTARDTRALASSGAKTPASLSGRGAANLPGADRKLTLSCHAERRSVPFIHAEASVRKSMGRLTVLLAVALAIPTHAAFAEQPDAAQRPGTLAPKVRYVLQGTLSNYFAPSNGDDGSITILVAHANYHGRALKSQSLTFAIASTAQIAFRSENARIADGAKGMIKFRAPLRVSGDIATTLAAEARAIHVVVQRTRTAGAGTS